MNTKAEQVVQGTSPADIAKYGLAVLVAGGGVAGYYLLTSWPSPLRVLLVVVAFAAALGVMALTALGRQGREFLRESLFELRKVVWPTQQEARRITLVVMIVVVVISLILFLMDQLIAWAIRLLLGN
jgi:preprotein translocase subunit SecE